MADLARKSPELVTVIALVGGAVAILSLAVIGIHRLVPQRSACWPWEGETFRTFLMSIAVTIVIWFVTSLPGRLLRS